VSDSISPRLYWSSAAARSAAPTDELIDQLRAMPGDDREAVLESLAERRPGFVARIRQMLAQGQSTQAADEAQAAQAVAEANRQAAAGPAQWDALEWMQGAQGLSLLDFLSAPKTSGEAETGEYQAQTAMSAYMANKFSL
jgi:hypothetical protein